MYFSTPTYLIVVICWRHSKRADSSPAFESADIDPYAIDSLIDTILEASSSSVLLPKFWYKHMPPNFRIKMILFQNSFLPVYHVATILFWDIGVTPDFPVWVLYNIPTISFSTHSTHLLSPFFLEQILTADAAIAKVSTLANPLPYHAFTQAIFLRLKSISAAMATSDHVPEVFFQVPVF